MSSKHNIFNQKRQQPTLLNSTKHQQTATERLSAQQNRVDMQIGNCKYIRGLLLIP